MAAFFCIESNSVCLHVWKCRFDCDVIEYCEEGSENGKYLVQYCDGIKEWRLLQEYRLVTDGLADEVHIDSSE